MLKHLAQLFKPKPVKKRKAQSSYDAKQKAAQASLKESRARTLASYRENRDIIAGVRTMSVYDDCDICQTLSKKIFSIDDAPKLPPKGCTCERGCRCVYSPVTK